MKTEIESFCSLQRFVKCSEKSGLRLQDQFIYKGWEKNFILPQRCSLWLWVITLYNLLHYMFLSRLFLWKSPQSFCMVLYTICNWEFDFLNRAKFFRCVSFRRNIYIRMNSRSVCPSRGSVDVFAFLWSLTLNIGLQHLQRGIDSLVMRAFSSLLKDHHLIHRQDTVIGI